jgi:hypothetical protein
MLKKKYNILVNIIAILVLTCIGSQAEPEPVFQAHADAVNNYIIKEYILAPDKSYTLKLSMQTIIKTYKGKKDRADFRYPYNSAFEQVIVNSARTVQPSGKILKAGKREIQDILDPSTSDNSFYSRARLRVINFPAVKLGSKLELELTIKNRLGFWPVESFRLNDPTVKKQVIVKIPVIHGKPVTNLTTKLDDPGIRFRKTMKKGWVVYSWTGKNLAAAHTEPMAPGLLNQNYCLIMSCLDSWSETSRFFRGKFHLNKRFEKTSIPEWATGKTPDHLYRAMLKHLTIYPVPVFETSLCPQDALATLKKGYGSSIDLAVLFRWILQKNGITSELVLANTEGDFIKPLKKTFSPVLFDQVLVRAKNRFYNFSDRDLPPGTSLAEESLGLDLDKEKLVPITSCATDTRKTDMILNISEQSSLSGHCTKIFTGMATVGIRGKMGHIHGKELDIEISALVHSIDPVAKLTQWFRPSGLSEPVQKIRLAFDFSLDTAFARSSGRYFFPVPSPGILSPLNRFLPDRHYPIALSRGETTILSITMNLAENLNPVFLPADTTGKSGPLSWEIKTEFKKGKLYYCRKIDLKRSIIPVNLVPEFLAKAAWLSSRQNNVIIFRHRPENFRMTLTTRSPHIHH